MDYPPHDPPTPRLRSTKPVWAITVSAMLLIIVSILMVGYFANQPAKQEKVEPTTPTTSEGRHHW